MHPGKQTIIQSFLLCKFHLLFIPSTSAEADVSGHELTLSDCLEHFTSTEQLVEKVVCISSYEMNLFDF